MIGTNDLTGSRIKLTTNKEKIELTKGQTDKITITSSGQQISVIANGFKPSLSATIDIKDLDVGEYDIKVTATDYDFGNKSISIPISIKEQVLQPTTLTLSKETTQIVKGSFEEITVTAEDQDNWNFINPNPKLIKLEKVGNNKIKITGSVVSNEVLVIPVTASKTGKKDTIKTISVKVIEDTILEILPEVIQDVSIGNKVNITAITNADTITAESSNISKATVEVSGKNVAVKGIAVGTSTITIKAKYGNAPEKQITTTANVVYSESTKLVIDSPKVSKDVLVEKDAKDNIDNVEVDFDNTHNIITITGNINELKEYQSSNSAQGSGKWIPLEIKTILPTIVGAKYNGSQLTESDRQEALGLKMPEGSFILWIKATQDYDRDITVEKDGIIETIKIKFKNKV